MNTMMTPFIRTVTGDISPEQLGVTQPHEHTIILPGKSCEVNPALLLDSPEIAVRELNDYKAAGGVSIVDAQPIGVERSPLLVHEIAIKSGVQIVAATGFHRPCFYPENHFLFSETAEQLAERIVSEVTEGMFDYSVNQPTSVKAGVVKWTSEFHYIPPAMQKAAEAAAIAHHRTGVPIITHTEHGTGAMEQIALIEKYGVKPSAMILCHTDRNPDKYLHKDIAQSGAYLVYDAVARTKYSPDSVIIDLIRWMFGAGGGGQIMVAMDTGLRTIWRHYGYGPGWDYLLKVFIPRLKRAGFSDYGVEQILVRNPASALRFRDDYR
jgi:phosphotriesterase-related protein